MSSLKCIAIDDEPLALEIIKDYAGKISFVELSHTFTNPLLALEYVRNNPVDLIFLDIQMPEISGLRLAELFQNSALVFTTAYKEFAIEGYNLDATDYLLKPFSFERFLKAVMKVMAAKTKGLPLKETTETEKSKKFKNLYVKTDKKIVSLSTRNLYYVQGLKDYVILMTTSGKLIVRESIKHMEEMLGNDFFIRVHKSYIISLHHINFIEGNEVRISEYVIPIGSSYKTSLLSRLNEGMIGKRID